MYSEITANLLILNVFVFGKKILLKVLFLVIVMVYSTSLKVWSYSVFEFLCIKCYKYDK